MRVLSNRRITYSNKHVVVTAAGSPVGRATALEFANSGAHVTLVDADVAGMDETAIRIRARGGQTHGYVADIGNARAVEGLAARIERNVGPVDVLVHGAAVGVAAPFAKTTTAEWEALMNLHLWGPLRLTRSLLPSMLARKSGQVVMLASIAGLFSVPGMVAYSTAMFARVGFAEGLRLELADTGVSVTSVCHGRTQNSEKRTASALVDGVSTKRALIVLGPEKLGWWLKRIAPETTATIMRTVARHFGPIPRSHDGATPSRAATHIEIVR
jgi:NAD(P)-dependent dehydrogenase (short-subunit alcohol dehydrogenase family)